MLRKLLLLNLLCLVTISCFSQRPDDKNDQFSGLFIGAGMGINHVSVLDEYNSATVFSGISFSGAGKVSYTKKRFELGASLSAFQDSLKASSIENGMGLKHLNFRGFARYRIKSFTNKNIIWSTGISYFSRRTESRIQANNNSFSYSRFKAFSLSNSASKVFEIQQRSIEFYWIVDVPLFGKLSRPSLNNYEPINYLESGIYRLSPGNGIDEAKKMDGKWTFFGPGFSINSYLEAKVFLLKWRGIGSYIGVTYLWESTFSKLYNYQDYKFAKNGLMLMVQLKLFK